MWDEQSPPVKDGTDGLDKMKDEDYLGTGNVDGMWLHWSTKQPGDADLIRVASVILAARLPVRLLQQEAVDQIQDMVVPRAMSMDGTVF